MLAKRLLVVGPSWVGDMMMAQSLFKVLKQQYPDLLIDVLAPAWTAPLLCRMPQVHQAIDMPVGHGQLKLKKRYQIAQQLRKNKYDWSIVLPNSLKSALIPFFAGIKKRTGFTGEMRHGLINDRHHLNKQSLTQTVQRFVSLAFKDEAAFFQAYPSTNSFPYPQLKTKKKKPRQLLVKLLKKNKLTLSLDELQATKVVALCPGAEYGPAKQWPAKYYAEISQKFVSQEENNSTLVLLLGSKKDQAICQQIKKYTFSSVIDLSGQTSLGEVTDILSLCAMVISNDSGLMHLAAAVKVPVIGIYGSSDINFTPPLSQKAKAISLNLECSPCFKRQCPQTEQDKKLKCLHDLTPELVWEQYIKLCNQAS